MSRFWRLGCTVATFSALVFASHIYGISVLSAATDGTLKENIIKALWNTPFSLRAVLSAIPPDSAQGHTTNSSPPPSAHQCPVTRGLFDVSNLNTAAKAWPPQRSIAVPIEYANVKGTPGSTGADFYPDAIDDRRRDCIAAQYDWSVIRNRRILFIGNSVARNSYFDLLEQLDGIGASFGGSRAAQKAAAKKHHVELQRRSGREGEEVAGLGGASLAVKSSLRPNEVSHVYCSVRFNATLYFRWQLYFWGLADFLNSLLTHGDVVFVSKHGLNKFASPIDIIMNNFGLNHILLPEDSPDLRTHNGSFAAWESIARANPSSDVVKAVRAFIDKHGGRIVWRTSIPIVPSAFTVYATYWWDCHGADNRFIQTWNRETLRSFRRQWWALSSGDHLATVEAPLQNSTGEAFSGFAVVDDFETVWALRRNDASGTSPEDLSYVDFVHPKYDLSVLLARQSLCALQPPSAT